MCDVKCMPTSDTQTIHSYHWNFHFLCPMAHLILHHLNVWCQQNVQVRFMLCPSYSAFRNPRMYCLLNK
jgi:hypothetical protein